LSLGHPGGWPHWLSLTGGFGVDLFFVLSSFLISELLLREKDDSGTLDVKAFWMRRILRIWPLYFTMLGIAFLVRHPFNISVGVLASYALFVGNFSGVLDHAPSMLIGSLWSVSIEEQFYLTWPLIVRRVSRRQIVRIAIGLWLFSLMSRALVDILNHGPVSLFVEETTFCRLDAIAVGLALSALRIRCSYRLRPVVAAVSLAMILAVGYWLFYFFSVTAQVFAFSIVSLACGGLVISGIGEPRLRARWAAYFGRISYGLYVFHGPSIILGRMIGRIVPWASVPTAILLTFVLAALSYRYLERPFLKLKERFQYVRSQENNRIEPLWVTSPGSIPSDLRPSGSYPSP
jgi:peptidoglycan/LPS O-acetylase OafA/YrhL